MSPRIVSLPVDNYYEGWNRPPVYVAVHTTEGARTVGSLAEFLRGIDYASYHDGIDDAKIGRFVNHSNRAWHLRNGNAWAVGVALCAFASWTREEWLDHPVMLENLAWYLAVHAPQHGIPLRGPATPAEVGELRWVDNPALGWVGDHDAYSDGTGDGWHWDVGENFPWDVVLPRAREIADQQTDPARSGEPMFVPVQLPPTEAPEDPESDPATWPRREETINLGYVRGWCGRLSLHFTVGHAGPGYGGQLFRAHVDYPDGPMVHWVEWPGHPVNPSYKQGEPYAFEAREQGHANLMITYAAPGGASLGVEYSG